MTDNRASVHHNTRHGHTVKGKHSPEYVSWLAMRRRCHDPKHNRWAFYGGRGITICARWLVFENFLADLGPRPSLGHSLDRVNQDGPYAPGNVRWATSKEQNRHTSRTRALTHDGLTLCLSEWSVKLGIPTSTLSQRFHKGLSAERILATDNLRRA